MKRIWTWLRWMLGASEMGLSDNLEYKRFKIRRR